MDENPAPTLRVDPVRSKRKAYRPTIREAVLLNASLPERDRLTNKELANKLGVRVQSVWVALSNLRGEGVISPKEAKPAKDIPGPAAIFDRSAMADRMLEQQLSAPLDEAAVEAVGEIMQKDERARRLSQIARLAPSNVSVLAVKALDEQERGSGLSVGPADPLDRSERVTRLAKLILAVGRPAAEEAFQLAYPAARASADDAPELDSSASGVV